MNKKILIMIFIVIVVVGAVLAMTVFKNGNTNEVAYKMEAVDIGNIQAVVDTTGTLNPVTTVDVGSQVSGKIQDLFVDFNSQVKKGQIIAKIDPELFETRVSQSEANYQSSKASLDKSKLTLENNKRKYERAKNLFEKELISFEEKETAETQYFSAVADLQSSEARLAQAKSQLDTSKVDLKNTIILSPIEGVVINRNFNVGQTVAASFQAPVLFQIANDLSKMQVECSVDEADIGKVKEGQKVSFTVDAFPNDKFFGEISQVRYSPEVISNVVTYTTIVEVDNPDIKLRPGMTATVSMVVGEAIKKLRVPNAALRFNPSQEVLMAYFEKMKAKMAAQRGDGEQTSSAAAGNKSNQGPRSGGFMGFGMGSGAGKSRMKDSGRVWILDDAGELKMIFIRIGVTDNVFTEVTGGELKEGIEVITGENGGSDSSRSNRSNVMRGMRMMMR
jgi:HlyD family secretion protein